MKAIPVVVAPALLVRCLLTGCQSNTARLRPGRLRGASQATENNCLACFINSWMTKRT